MGKNRFPLVQGAKVYPPLVQSPALQILSHALSPAREKAKARGNQLLVSLFA
jgi:hypothetical protein